MTLKVIMALAYTVAVPATVGAASLITRKKQSNAIAPLSYLFIGALFFEILATLWRILFYNNLIIVNMASVAEGWIILYILRQQLIKSGVSKRQLEALYPVGPVVFTIIAVGEALSKGISFYNASYTTKNVLIIVGLFFLVWKVANGMNIARWLYYILGGFLLYFVSNFIFFLTASPLMDKDILQFIYDIHNVTNALINLFFGFALWKLSNSKLSLLHS
jgi:hypothetical protein